MEHIQQAIEKARKERQGAIGNNDNSEISFNDDQRHFTPGESRAINTGHEINPEYSKTRSITISDADLKARKLFAGFAHDPRSEPYRQLRSQILKTMRLNGWRTLAITSPTAGNGKTLTAVNLAISLSQEVNQTVLLVDFDLRKPGVAAAFGINDIHHGIVDAAMRNVSVDEVLINPGFSRLVIAPGTAQGHLTSEILSSPKMQLFQKELRERYLDRFIIFDLPALLVSDDALVFTPHADAVLLVLEDGGASERELTQAMKLLEGTNILGSILNRQQS